MKVRCNRREVSIAVGRWLARLLWRGHAAPLGAGFELDDSFYVWLHVGRRSVSFGVWRMDP